MASTTGSITTSTFLSFIRIIVPSQSVPLNENGIVETIAAIAAIIPPISLGKTLE